MPLWVILVVAGVLVVAALVLIIAVHILDVHAEQQCAHLHDLTQRSLQQNQDQTQYQYRCGESQLCCVCGSVRNRRLQATGGNNSNLRAKSIPKLSTVGGLFQPLMDAAYGKASLSSGSLECLSGLTSKRKGMASGFQGGWFNGRRFFRGNGGSQETHGRMRVDSAQAPVSGAGATSAASSCSTSAAISGSPSRTAGQSDSDAMTTITATITTTADPSTSSLSSSGTNTPSSSSGNEGGVWKPIPQRRLVLEILMSPSNTGDGQGGTVPRATGVRLKLETNASLESLASLAAAASSGAENASQSEGVHAESLTTALATGHTCNTSSGPVSTYEVTTGNASNVAGANCDINRATVPGTTGDETRAALALLSTAVANRCNLGSPELSTAKCMSGTAAKISTSSAEYDPGTNHGGSSAGQTSCCTPLDKRTGGFGSPSTASPNALAAVPCKTRPNGHLNCSVKAKSKVGSCNTSNLSAVSAHGNSAVSAHGNSAGSTGTPLKGAHNQATFGLPLDGLGCLRISVLDGIAKGKSIKDCSKGVTAEIASALAALSVETIGGKCVRMGLTLAPGGASSDTAASAGLSEKVDVVQEEEGLGEGSLGEGSGSEHVTEEGDERHPRPEAAEEDEGDGNKKEKRKKKNRGRRHKAKAAAVAAAAAGLEAQERHLNGKHCVEVVGTMPVAGESEVGCICGTPRGACHSGGCPYPFTSSGSMVQRKIKEQYDELVRSNVSKTLTLAQVGRFTTCLVEAKSALQLKSDTIQRRFTIAKSLLSKADKSSFDRLCGQIYGLEIEQKKLEEDTVVYNRLQEQLKLSPAYQKMLEYGRTHFELQPNTGQLIEKVDSEDVEISFEELLAQEKKDSFWQKHGPPRSSMQVS